MSFKLQPIEGDKWELVFSDELTYIHPLKMAPEAALDTAQSKNLSATSGWTA
jgi:hypothetical protein